MYGKNSNFNFSGGTITGNEAVDGGAVYLNQELSTLNMTGGEISGNTATANGGAVYMYRATSTLNLSGGTIQNNTAGSSGGAVYFNTTSDGKIQGILNISGNPVVKDNTVSGKANNISLKTGKTLSIVEAMTDGASVGITTESTDYPVVFSNAYDTDYSGYFFADDANAHVNYNIEKKLELATGAPHTHSWATAWSKDETHHWHDCTADGCNVTNNADKDGYAAHTYDQEIATADYKASDATCTEKATYYKSCICGAKGTETFESGDVDASNHTFGAWINEVPATCKTTGTKGHKDCSGCGKHFDADGNEITDLIIPFDPDNHEGAPGDWQTDPDKHWKEYSCCSAEVEEGKHVYTDDTDTTCNTCGYIRTITPVHTHSWATAWSKNETHHWHECTAEGCDVTDNSGKQGYDKHSGTDDGDCTTAVICECGYVITAANADHTYGEVRSNGNDTHTLYCTVEGCGGYETEDCAGGQATYFIKALCGTCNTEYGKLLTDSTAPTGEITVGTNKWNSFLNTITFGLFFKETQSVTITASDDSYSQDGYTDDKAVKIEYYLYSGNTALTQADLAKKEFTIFNGNFNIDPDNRYVVYARLTDHAGNITYISSEGVVLDASVPVISGIENGKTYCDAVEFEVSDNDGIASVKAGEAVLKIGTNGKYTLEKGIGKVTVVATDNAGNTTRVTVTVNNGHTGGEATCTEKAVCKVCGEEYGELDSTNHDLEKIPAKDATVTEPGNKEYWHCLDCGRYFADENGKKEIALADTVITKLPPEIIKGAGQSITEGEKKALSFTSNAAFSDFIRVEIDGKTLDEKNYTVNEGSTVVTLKADYVATLSVGKYTIGIVSENGTATTTFTVNVKAAVNEDNAKPGMDNDTADGDKESPHTGDNSHMVFGIALLVAGVFGLAGTAVYRKRKSAR